MKKIIQNMVRMSINVLLFVLLVQLISASSANASDIPQTDTKGDTTTTVEIEDFQKSSLVLYNYNVSDKKSNSRLINNNATQTSTATSTSINPDENTDAEVSDLLDLPTAPPKTDENEPIQSSGEMYRPFAEVDLSIISSNDRYDVEQSFRDSNKKSNYVIDDFESINNGDSKPPEYFVVVQSKMAIILAGVFVVICIFGYGTLLFWRRFLENRYGNSQMLVTDDDDIQREDSKYFSI